MTKILPLAGKHGAGWFVYVDEEDYERLSRHSWRRCNLKDGTGYAARTTFYRNDVGVRRPRFILMHREIIGAPLGVEVDHIDRNKLNNTKVNLRLATRQQQAWNSPVTEGTSSRFRGVSWNKGTGKWNVQICRERKIHYVGLFSDELEAAAAYDERSRELFGEFACVNLPEAR